MTTIKAKHVSKNCPLKNVFLHTSKLNLSQSQHDGLIIIEFELPWRRAQVRDSCEVAVKKLIIAECVMVMNRFKLLVTWMLLVGGLIRAIAALPTTEELLPEDTLAVASIRDWDQTWLASTNSAFSQFWADAAMKPFRNHFEARLAATMQLPLEKELGIQWADYQDILRGQVTLAILPSSAPALRAFDWILIIDSKDKSDHLKAVLDGLRKKWAVNGQQVKTEMIRGCEFSHLTFPQNKIFELVQKLVLGEAGITSEETSKSPDTFQCAIGQAQSLLLIGNSSQCLEMVITRLNRLEPKTLAHNSAFKIAQAKSLRTAQAYVLLLSQPLYTMAMKYFANDKNETLPGLKADKLMASSGLAGLQALSFKWETTPEGKLWEVFAAVPQNVRDGLMGLFLPQSKDASPISIIPQNAVTFHRFRWEGQKVWNGVENLIGNIDPGLVAMIQLAIITAGKDTDLNFDFKKNLIERLGDDLIIYQNVPQFLNPISPQVASQTVLIGSTNSTLLLGAIRASLSILPEPYCNAPVVERTYLGRKIYTMNLQTPLDEAGAKLDFQNLHAAAINGYVVFSGDAASVEEALRNNETPVKSLRDSPGMAQAARSIGGFNTGIFGYENIVEKTRRDFESLRKDPSTFEEVMFGFPVPILESGPGKGWQNLFNFSLLPPFDQVSKYFHIEVNSLSTTPEGISYKSFRPIPPQVKK